ncbi:MAG TPA: GNAT family N-acetyltransferase [Solirubrobacteraceae bacterium]|nr:GNAT family N-acetyltransferase [Solirubrobacteraceae bacterium]
MTALKRVPETEWDARLDALGLNDAYLRRGYLLASAQLTGGEPTLLHLAGDGGDVVFAALLRSEPVDLVTPYGYGGPVSVGAQPPVDAFAAAYDEWCRAQGAVSTFAVFHPLFANAAHAPGFHVQPIGDTIAWPLPAGADLMAGMHRHHRRMARRALNAGAEVRVTVPGDLAALAGFRELYTQTMARAGADPFYFFAEPYWAALADGVAMVCVEVWHDGEQLAGALGLTGRPWLHYHLGAGSDAGRALGASHLALYGLACWGQEQGYELLHLGGGVGGRRDSLFTYKERFAPGGERAAAIGKAVHDPERYRALTGRPEISYDGFFPAYRAAH